MQYLFVMALIPAPIIVGKVGLLVDSIDLGNGGHLQFSKSPTTLCYKTKRRAAEIYGRIIVLS
jgi:hypothetical protein